MKTKRSYTMGARAQGVEETRQRIIEALFELANVRTFPEISLDDIASAAGVSVQTVLRQFGSRAELIETTIDHAVSRITQERAAPVGDVGAAMRVLVSHYELRGEITLLMLSQEHRDAQVARVTERGRQLHRQWVEQVFAGVAHGDEALTDLLVVATDVYTWKLLRRDRGLSRSQTEQRMRQLVEAVLGQAREAGP